MKAVTVPSLEVEWAVAAAKAVSGVETAVAMETAMGVVRATAVGDDREDSACLATGVEQRGGAGPTTGAASSAIQTERAQ